MNLAMFLATHAEMHEGSLFSVKNGGLGKLHGDRGVAVEVDIYVVLLIQANPRESGTYEVVFQLREIHTGATPAKGIGELKVGEASHPSYHVVPLKGIVPYGRYSAEVTIGGRWSASVPFAVFRLGEEAS